MKITSSMKNVVMKAIETKNENDRKAKNKEITDYAIQLNSKIIDSVAYHDFIQASKALNELVDSTIKDAKLPVCISYGVRQRFDGAINDDLYIVPDTRGKTNTRDVFDSIMVKLEYGKDFDEAKAILSEYGIDI